MKLNRILWLQLCVILEPMQELMCRHKVYGLSPRDCLKTTLFQKWQRIVAPPGELLLAVSWKKHFRNVLSSLETRTSVHLCYSMIYMV